MPTKVAAVEAKWCAKVIYILSFYYFALKQGIVCPETRNFEEFRINNEKFRIKNDEFCRSAKLPTPRISTDSDGQMTVPAAAFSSKNRSASLHLPSRSHCDWAWRAASVSFQWKNPDFLFRNPDFLLKNVDYIIQQAWWVCIEVQFQYKFYIYSSFCSIEHLQPFQ